MLLKKTVHLNMLTYIVLLDPPNINWKGEE